MKNIFLLLGVLLLAGCSYNLKTSLIDDVAEIDRVDFDGSVKECGESVYCRLEALSEIDSFKDYEQIQQLGIFSEDSFWDMVLRKKIPLAATTPEDCNDLIDGSALQTQCLYALAFNQKSAVNCLQEGVNQDICFDQQVLTDPNQTICSAFPDIVKHDACFYSLALSKNQQKGCDFIKNPLSKADCRSSVSGSLDFCKDKKCIDHFVWRHYNAFPHGVSCRFDDEVLQSYCKESLLDLSALSENNFLYCTTQHCYGLLVDKYNYLNPEASVEKVQSVACNVLSRPKSLEGCSDYVSEKLAILRDDISLCSNLSCLDSFKGSTSHLEVSKCEVFASEDGDVMDLFSVENQMRDECFMIIQNNKALFLEDESLCLDEECLESVREKF